MWQAVAASAHAAAARAHQAFTLWLARGLLLTH
jgi:hypothetical protein